MIPVLTILYDVLKVEVLFGNSKVLQVMHLYNVIILCITMAFLKESMIAMLTFSRLLILHSGLVHILYWPTTLNPSPLSLIALNCIVHRY